MKRILIPGIILLYALFQLLSCTGEAPQIKQVFWQLNISHDPAVDRRGEYLSLFVHVDDGDGIDDIDLHGGVSGPTRAYGQCPDFDLS